MSLPPQAISIKRKRGEEPPDSLYLERSKRHATNHEFVFRRQIASEPQFKAPPAPVSQPAGIPRILPSKPGEETRNGHLTPSQDPAPEDTPAQDTQLPSNAPLQQQAAGTPRCFKLSHRASSSQGGLANAQLGTESLALFVEKRRNNAVQSLMQESAHEVAQEPSTRKRPGVRGKFTPATVPMGATANLDSEAERAMMGMAAEYNAQHRSIVKDAVPDTEMFDAGEEGAEEDYVYETYIRHRNLEDDVGSTTMDTMAKAPGNIGYLIINDEDQAVWETYADGEDESEHDWDSENDDENAENYYGADYPEDEVESDDEHGLHPYQYRNRAASDDEEFGSDDGTWSGDERNHHPWGAVRGELHRLNPVGMDDDEEEEEEDEDDSMVLESI